MNARIFKADSFLESIELVVDTTEMSFFCHGYLDGDLCPSLVLVNNSKIPMDTVLKRCAVHRNYLGKTQVMFVGVM